VSVHSQQVISRTVYSLPTTIAAAAAASAAMDSGLTAWVKATRYTERLSGQGQRCKTSLDTDKDNLTQTEKEKTADRHAHRLLTAWQ